MSEILIEEELICNVLPVALKNKWFKPALLPDVLKYEKFTGEDIAEKINLELEKANYQTAQFYF